LPVGFHNAIAANTALIVTYAIIASIVKSVLPPRRKAAQIARA
jgi:hypothetical protein